MQCNLKALLATVNAVSDSVAMGLVPAICGSSLRTDLCSLHVGFPQV